MENFKFFRGVASIALHLSLRNDFEIWAAWEETNFLVAFAAGNGTASLVAFTRL